MTIRNSFLEYLSRYKTIVLVIIGAIILTIIVLHPGQTDLNKIEGLYNRGQYQAVRVGLEKELNKDPEWHEARTLLAQAELSDGRLVEALEHMLILAGAGWDIHNLEIRLSRWLYSGQLEPEMAKLIVDFVSQESHQFPHWGWLRKFGLEVAAGWAIEELPDYLLYLGEEDFKQNRALVEQGWYQAQDSGAWEAAWRISLVIDKFSLETSEVIWQGIEYRARMVQRLRMHPDPGFWSTFQAKFPGDSMAAIGRALSMHPNQGLDWLTEWEGTNQISNEAAGYYSLYKGRMLQRAEKIETAHLANVEPGDLLAAALTPSHNKTKLLLILNYMEQYPELAEELKLVIMALDAPEPEWVIDAHWGVLTEDGKSVILRQGDKTVLHNIVSGKRVEFDFHVSYLSSSPDGSKLALAVVLFDDSHKLHLYTDQGEFIQELILDYQASFVGWMDSNRIWLSMQRASNFMQLHILNLTDGSISWVDDIIGVNINAQLRSGPGGRIAWFMDRQVGVWDGVKVSLYEYKAGINALSWSPDGSRLALTMGSELYIQDLGGEVVALDLPRRTMPSAESVIDIYPYKQFLAWRNREELYFNYLIGSSLSHLRMLAIYNLRTGEISMTGIINPESIAGKRVMSTSESKLLVYDIR